MPSDAIVSVQTLNATVNNPTFSSSLLTEQVSCTLSVTGITTVQVGVQGPQGSQGSQGIPGVVERYSAISGEVSAILPGSWVYTHTSSVVKLAIATSLGTSHVVGVVTSMGSGSNVNTQTVGVVTLTTSQWDATMGTTGGLTPGVTYFLSSISPGGGTSSPADVTGNILISLGCAMTSTDFRIAIDSPVVM